MKQLTLFEERDIWEEWHKLLDPYRKGISGGCYLCPLHQLCKGRCCGDGTITHGSKEKLEQVMEHIVDNYDFDKYYRKWKLDMLHRYIKKQRREWWKYYNGLEPKGFCDDDLKWERHWLDSLEQIEREQRWDWTLEEEWTDYKKWRKENKDE